MTISVSHKGFLTFKGQKYRCALGKGGVKTEKTEGDGVSPTGTYTLRRVLYRADRLAKPETSLEITEIQPDDGWCDEPEHEDYNRQVKLPFAPSHEKLMRDDNIYDIIVVLGHNDHPPIPYKGSAIFFHLARENFTPTEGCVAITLEAMLEILKNVKPDEEMEISL